MSREFDSSLGSGRFKQSMMLVVGAISVTIWNLTSIMSEYFPATIAILNAACAVRSLHLLVFWILFENVMSLHRSKATIIGLLEANRGNEWVVTEKLGNAMKQKSTSRPSKKPKSRITERFHVWEIVVGMFLLHCAVYDMLYGMNHFYAYLVLQAGAFFVMGFGNYAWSWRQMI